MKAKGSYHANKVLNKILRCDLESRSRSLVFKLDLGLAGIHIWYNFWDSTWSLREVIMLTRFVTDGRMETIPMVPRRGRRGTISWAKRHNSNIKIPVLSQPSHNRYKSWTACDTMPLRKMKAVYNSDERNSTWDQIGWAKKQTTLSSHLLWHKPSL